MSASARDLEALRASRDAAKAVFDRRYGAIRADMEERGIAGRIIDESLEVARDVFDDTVAVIEDNPGVLGGTLAALALWIFRSPILAVIGPWLGLEREDNEETENG